MRFAKYFGLIGLALFAFLVWKIGPENIVNSFLKINLAIFFAGFGVGLLTVFLKGYKQNLLLQPLGKSLRLWDSMKIWVMGYFFGAVSPGRSGDFFKAIYISRLTGITKGKCLTVTVIERLLDLSLLFIFGILGMLYFTYFVFSGKSEILIMLLGFFALFILAIALMTQKRIVEAFAKPVFRFLVPGKISKKLALGFTDFYLGLNAYLQNKKVLFKVFAVALIAWLFTFLQYYIFAFAVNVPIPFYFIVVVVPAFLLISTLPISVAGLGTRDVTIIFFLSFLAIAPADAIAFSLSILLSEFLMACLGFILFQFRPRKGVGIIEA